MQLPKYKFKTAKQNFEWTNTFRGRYSKSLEKHPFALFGLPVLASLCYGTYLLSYFTALRYERHDAKVKQVTEEESLQVERGKRKVSVKDEFYRLQNLGEQDNWEQVRVPRMEGESENVW
ncbi:cytochrome c oxidase assembly protein COX16, mitochondrial [Nadsonia fulvescens var. elongata DSM 6958]|uniref:Cytochrome c oxidase assembly protein COX16, mitochondrial n=1 Tax=Nadsonia fulvescens var. elongata DSM 6958 TaxID=857566 RepID=A0A1E3PI10_9ASCO|nr:cytochrome c oxidase assembly protein COX16, mitochondrial [Nadsonia fulvescens var. elongata DSM 6958]